MSVRTHCDGPGCNESVAGEDLYVMENMAGDVVLGWSTLTAGSHVWNFHNLACLAAWGAFKVDERAARPPQGAPEPTSQASGGA